MDATAEREFREFVAVRSAALLRTAYLLTGQREAAEDLLQTSLAKAANRWSRLAQPEAYVRKIMYHQQVERVFARRTLYGSRHSVVRSQDRAVDSAATATQTGNGAGTAWLAGRRPLRRRLGVKQRKDGQPSATRVHEFRKTRQVDQSTVRHVGHARHRRKIHRRRNATRIWRGLPGEFRSAVIEHRRAPV